MLSITANISQSRFLFLAAACDHAQPGREKSAQLEDVSAHASFFPLFLFGLMLSDPAPLVEHVSMDSVRLMSLGN